MTVKQWVGLAPVLLALACAKEADMSETVHEKEGSTEAAALAGWDVEPIALESNHRLGNNLKEVFEVDAPDTARKFRLRFSRISMERNYDYLVIQDQHGNELERVTGAHRNYVSRTIQGKKAKIILETDYSVSSWGFTLDEVRHRGCNPNAPTVASMRGARNCTDLRDAIRELAIKQVRKRFTEGHFGGPIILRNTAAPEARTADAPAHSETNTQVAGVDEADIVKTDGNRIYSLAGRQLRIFKSWPAAGTELEHEVDLEGFPKGMFLDGDTLTVLSGVQGDHFAPIGGPGLPVARIAPIWWRPDGFTKVTVIDVAGGTPRVTSETLVAGQFQNARRVGDAVRLVLRRNLSWPAIQYYPQNVDWNSAEFDRAMDQLEADAVRAVTNRALSDWLPTSYRVQNGVRVPLSIECDDYQVHTTGDSLGLTSVVTVNTGATPVSIQDTSLLVNPRQIYQSRENLYITTDHQWSCYEDSGTEGQFTYVHKLDVSDPTRTSYKATGGFVGGVLNQFSMDERDGYLRVASTNQKWRAETEAERSVSRVYVLGEVRNRRRLEIVGQTPDMAPGERIFSSRFVGDRGFVVTFRQVDPLFTLDLSDPTNPTIVGELKIPGFSTYLHVLDEDHLFAIGNDFETDGTTRNGVALTIFDVSDMTAPRLKHKAVIGSTRGHSEALYDHKAFTMFRQPGANHAVLAIPFTDWDRASDDARYWGTFKSTLKVFAVSAGGIIENGEIDHSGLFEGNETNRWGWWYRPNVRRGVFVEDYVYAISDAGLRVAETDDPTTIVAEVAAEPQYENPTPTNPTITDSAEDKPGLRIPDANSRGASATLELTEDLTVDNLTVEIDITHTYKGDLVLTLTHDGVTETLHDRTGGSADNITKTFTTERFRGKNSKGTWTLKMVDTARWDVGALKSWKISATGKKASGGGTTPTPTVVTRTFDNDQKVDIPDNNRTGITSEIQVPQSIEIEEIEVEVNIRHTYRGDLYVVLEHDGTQVKLHDRSGGSADNLRLSVSPDEFIGDDGAGTWTLRVIDTARLDLGVLEGWSISLTGTQQ